MRTSKFWIILTLLLLGVGLAHSQEKQVEFKGDFRENSVAIDHAFYEQASFVMAEAELVQAMHATPSAPSAEFEVEKWRPCVSLKTNLLGLAASFANVGVEADLAKHVSIYLPIYYSAWNYFTTPVKLRALATQPEVRFWTSKENDGFFAGAHFGLAYYNVAFNGDYRYQDCNGDTPAIGGGLNIGYRIPVSKNNRWKMEFSLGAGRYTLHYDKFYNTENTGDGFKAETVEKTYWGIDQASVSLAYTFGLNKKGGKR